MSIPSETTDSGTNSDNERQQEQQVEEQRRRHDVLKKHPVFWASVGVFQTLTTAGIVFGWASLLPVLRNEGVDNTPQQFAQVFTYGAIGNYLSTLLFGVTLDKFGPRITAILASALFGLGLFLSSHASSYLCLSIGFGLLGFAGPGIQMPTLHLANLFSSSSSTSRGDGDGDGGSGGGGGAFYMSSQAAAFDGGTLVFAVVRYFHLHYDWNTTNFFRLYMIVPGSVLVTAIFFWPDTVLDNTNNNSNNNTDDDQQTIQQELAVKQNSPYLGPASSPYLSPRFKKKTKQQQKQQGSNNNNNNETNSLVNAPLSVVLKHPSFWSLAIWVSVHILKLNFVVATLNDQLEDQVEHEQAESLIDLFGAILPFGFVALPLVAFLLNRSANWVIQIANIVGIAYGAILVWCPSNTWLLSLIVFPAVATSRQMVYSTVFHQIGEVFGFANYGILLGSTNILVSTVSAIQNPLVDLSETVGDYTTANSILLLLTVPLFFVVGCTTQQRKNDGDKNSKKKSNSPKIQMEEQEPLLAGGNNRKPRSYSSTFTDV